jgi:aspartyl-tRNA(Asn)/glutamyl-tRNA(Gln) amidotransferase subunit B
VNWQIDQIEDGFTIQQATVLYNPDTGETRAMRSKEDSADYRYFPDPTCRRWSSPPSGSSA